MKAFLRTSLAMVAGLGMLSAACSGSSDSDDDATIANSVAATLEASAKAEETPEKEATATKAANTAVANTQAPSATRAATSAPAVSPTAAVAAGLTAEKWTHEICILAANFSKVAGAAGTVIAEVDPASAGARAKIVAEYAKIVAAIDIYANAVAALPAPAEPGGGVAKATWLAATLEARQQNHTNSDIINALPDNADFAFEYDQATQDYRMDFGDSTLRGDLYDLGEQYPITRVVIEATDNDPACTGIFDA